MKKIIGYLKRLPRGECIVFFSEFLVVLFCIVVDIVQIWHPMDTNQLLSVILFAVGAICGANLCKTHILPPLYPQSKIGRRENIDIEYPLYAMWEGAVSIDIAAVSCINISLREHGIYKESLRKGVDFRIIAIDPNSNSYEEHFKYKLPAWETQQSSQASKEALSALIQSASPYENKLQAKYTYASLPYSIMIVTKRNTRESVIKVDFYSIGTTSKDRPSMIIPHSDIDKFEFFKKQFDAIWDTGE